MEKNNITTIYLLGFHGLHNIKILLFVFLLIIYFLILLGNSLVVLLVSIGKKLQTPMYIFLTQLSLLDILVTTDILPNMLYIILYEGGSISLASCIVQLCFFGCFDSSECFLLMVMSYDRYLAICRPLHYSSLVNKLFCLKSIVLSWMFGFSLQLIDTISISNLLFCGPNIIDHFFCDFEPLVRLSCSDTFAVHLQTIILAFFIIACPFLLIMMSYLCIIGTILKIQSVQGRQKAFFTCSSHLTVVSLFYGTLFSVYMVPKEGQLVILSKILSLLYTVVAPLLNPAIYTIRNKDFKETFQKLKTFVV